MNDHICCDSFRLLLKRAGSKGYSAVAVEDGSSRFFQIQARPFERAVSDYLNTPDPQTKTFRWPDLRAESDQLVPWVFILHMPIKFCPYCGKSLESVIASMGESFSERAKKDSPLLNR